jgi:outer membrane protein assembly factor BamB
VRIDAKHVYGTVTIDVVGLKDGRYEVTFDCPIRCNHASTGYGGSLKSVYEGRQVNQENNVAGLLERVDVTTGSLDRGVLVFELDHAYGGEKTVVVKIPVTNGVLGAVQVHTSGRADPVDLRLEGNRLRGRLNMTIPHTTGLLEAFARDAHPWYEIDAVLEDGKIAGTYKGEWGDYRKFDCVVEGRVLDADVIRATAAVDPAADWPFWWGPNQNGSAVPRGHKLVDNLTKSELAWVSEQTPPGRGQNSRYREGNLKGLMDNGMEAGGCSSPIVYQGRVYQNYVRPSGEPYDQAVLDTFAKEKKKDGQIGVRTAPKMWSLECDLVVLCIDAATGQTLWKTVFPRVGPYDLAAKRGAFTAFMSAGEGRVFGLTTKNETFCLDAASGELQWVVADGEGELSQVIGGVYVSVDKSGLFGLDVKTGQRLWTVADIGGEVGAPLNWKHGGKDYVIVGDEINGTGKLACVSPTDGSVVWKVDGYGMTTFPALMGDYLVINGAKDKSAASFVKVSRLTLKGPEEVWKLDPEEYPFSDTRNCITGDGKTLIAVFPGLDKQGSADQIVAFDVATGKVLSRAPAGNFKFGHSWMMEDRVVVQVDTSHGGTPLTYFSFADGKLSSLGDPAEAWHTRYATTSGYTPVVFNHCLVDGRLIVRGGRGIVCYDLRASAEPAGEDGRATPKTGEQSRK